VITRFAPSPTGLLHLGHVFAAKFAHDLARSHQGGEFLLRFEDIDTTRVRDPYYQMIEEDLHWLGIEWDQTPLRQIDRLDAYADALETLKKLEVVYPCFCTRREIKEEIKRMGNAPHDGEESLYPRICRKKKKAERESLLRDGVSHCWRLDAEKSRALIGSLTFEDRIHGCMEVDYSILGDVVLARKDIATSYHLAVVIDDAFQGISDVTRGEDLLNSTHIHRILQALLHLPEPVYHHHRLIVDSRGKRLAKRDESMSVRDMRQRGVTAEEIFEMIQ